MPRPGGVDRGIYEATKPCPACGNKKCARCRGRRPCKRCPCSKCSACGGTGHKGTGVWWVCYIDPAGKKRRERIGPKSLAREVYEARKTEIRRGEYFPPRHKDKTVSQAIDAHLANVGRGSGRGNWRENERLGKLWRGELGAKRLADVTEEDVTRLRNRWLVALKPQTVRNMLGFLRHVYTLAVRRGDVPRNPLSGTLPEAGPPRVRWLTAEEEAALKALLTAEDFEIVELAYHTGLRRGELFRLRREDTDLDERRTRLLVGRTKKKWHEVQLNERAVEILARRLASHKGEWVFVGPRGARLDPNNWYRRVLLPVLDQVGIKYDFRFHDLRHTTATRLRRRGARLEDVADVLGHSGLNVTRRYAHILPDGETALMDMLVTGRETAHGQPWPSSKVTVTVTPPGS